MPAKRTKLKLIRTLYSGSAQLAWIEFQFLAKLMPFDVTP